MKHPLIAAMALCVFAFPIVAEATGKKPITAASTKIVRGANGGTCEATAIGNGNNPSVGVNEDLTNLSVSCSDQKGVSWSQLRAPLPNAHACVATLGDLRKRNKYVTIVGDPTDDNPYHCLLEDITPKQFVAGSNYQN